MNFIQLTKPSSMKVLINVSQISYIEPSTADINNPGAIVSLRTGGNLIVQESYVHIMKRLSDGDYE